MQHHPFISEASHDNCSIIHISQHALSIRPHFRRSLLHLVVSGLLQEMEMLYGWS